MSKRILALATCLVAAGLWAGCAVETGQHVRSVDPNAALAYFPVSDGYTVTYDERHSDGRSCVIRYEAGNETDMGTKPAREWRMSSSTGDYHIGYIRVEADRALVYERISSVPEVVIQMPLTLGASWNRFSVADDDILFDDGIEPPPNDEGELQNGDTTSNPGGGTAEDENAEDTFNKLYTDGEATGAFPTDGSYEMVVDRIENLTLESGRTYTDAVRVTNSGTSGRFNYYWYVQGVGLVKYVINSRDTEEPTGQIVGEMVDFSR